MYSLFGNGFDSNFDELQSYYPVWYREIIEMVALWDAMGKQFDDLEDAIDLTVLNNLILKADKATITRLEKFIRLTTDSTKPLDERRRLVLAYFVGFGKISASKIKNIIWSFTNADSKVKFTPGDIEGNNYLYIMIERGDVSILYYKDIMLVLSSRIPAHIAYVVSIEYSYTCVVGFPSILSYPFEYDICGTSPEDATLGLLSNITTVAEKIILNNIFDYPACDGTLDNCGLIPDASTLAVLTNIATITNDFTTASIVDYPACGELYAE